MDIDKLVEQIYQSTKRTVTFHDEGKVLDVKTIRELVEPLLKLIEEAKQQKKYMYIKPLSMWINPNEYENKLEKGWYVYHTDSLELRSPLEWIEELEKDILEERKEFKKVLKDVAKYISDDEKKIENKIITKIIMEQAIKESKEVI